MELRGHVDDPHGEAACDTSGYHPAVVQLFALGAAEHASPLSKRDALCAEPLATRVLPDQGGWPRAFCDASNDSGGELWTQGDHLHC
jgi:hypothetical protein